MLVGRVLLQHGLRSETLGALVAHERLLVALHVLGEAAQMEEAHLAHLALVRLARVVRAAIVHQFVVLQVVGVCVRLGAVEAPVRLVARVHPGVAFEPGRADVALPAFAAQVRLLQRVVGPHVQAEVVRLAERLLAVVAGEGQHAEVDALVPLQIRGDLENER